ncbi:unnamed protein product [Gongylonema pulchrum]|uniref:DUF19 domain-containing protein n=1 Tax=Gongylonema pulchrum TaxID=637853 RepID=A0A183DX81_9BILA|nr:unnamed protein product [Gongylonema pulchrum]
MGGFEEVAGSADLSLCQGEQRYLYCAWNFDKSGVELKKSCEDMQVAGSADLSLCQGEQRYLYCARNFDKSGVELKKSCEDLAQAWRSVSFHRDDGCYWSTATYGRICSNDVLLDYVFFERIVAKMDAFSRAKLRRDFTSSASEDLYAAVMK